MREVSVGRVAVQSGTGAGTSERTRHASGVRSVREPLDSDRATAVDRAVTPRHRSGGTASIRSFTRFARSRSPPRTTAQSTRSVRSSLAVGRTRGDGATTRVTTSSRRASRRQPTVPAKGKASTHRTTDVNESELDRALAEAFDGSEAERRVVVRQALDLAASGKAERDRGTELTVGEVVAQLNDAPDGSVASRWNWWLGALEVAYGGYREFQVQRYGKE